MDGESWSVRIVLFAEDPGAANFIGEIAERFRAAADHLGFDVLLCAQSNAAKLLAQKKIRHTLLEEHPEASTFFDLFEPAVIIVGTAENPDTFGLKLIDEARRRSIASIGVVDSFINAEFRFRGDGDHAFAHEPHHLLVPDASTRDAFTRLGFDHHRIDIVGQLHLESTRSQIRKMTSSDRNRIREEVFPDAADGQKVITFLSEKSSGFDNSMFRRAPDYTLHGSGQYDGRTEIVMEEFLSACDRLHNRPYLSCRLHPKCARADFEPLISRFDDVQSGGDATLYVQAADMVVGMTTSLLSEAAAMNKRTVSVVPRQVETRWIPQSVIDVIEVVWERDALDRAIRSGVADGNRSASTTSGGLDTKTMPVANLVQVIRRVCASQQPGNQ